MSQVVDRLNAALEGRYEIERELGEGGMATVYLARDLRHDRNVALKVLRPELAAVVGGERFLAEIKTTAALQHPHVLPLHDSGEADSFLFYVMPHVEGESLRDRLQRDRQLPVDEAVEIARKVASALQYAHEQGVIHRDIKPANILMSRGEPLVADFGIALALTEAGGGRITETGLSLGTPHYMSPEQAAGERSLDVRSDVYALGSVLYEMLTGEPPYGGPNAQAVLARILTEQPRRVTDIRRTVPPNVEAAVAKALEKLPADRFASAEEFQRALQDPAFRHVSMAPASLSTAPVPVAPAKDEPAWLPWGAAALMAVLAAWGWFAPAGAPATAPSVRAVVDLGDIQSRFYDEVVISPDGSHLAVTGTVAGGTGRGLWVRRVDEERFRLLTDEGEPEYPSFSPEGDWIVYEDQGDRSMKKIALSGGAPRPVVPASEPQPRMPHWGDDGTIVFLGGSVGIYRVPDSGGEPTLLVEGNYALPRLLPGSRGVLLTQGGDRSVHYLDLEADTVRELVPGGLDPRYVDTGHLLWADEQGGLWAAPFDLQAGELTGDATPVLEGLSLGFFFARFDVSRNGTLVYGLGPLITSTAGAPSELLVVGLDGQEQATPLEPRVFDDVRWAPDGERVAYSGTEAGSGSPEQSIYTYNVTLGTTPRRLTFEGGNWQPVWSPDGARIAFSSNREGTESRDLFVKTVDDDAPPVRVLGGAGRQRPTDWPEGELVLLNSGTSPQSNDIWTIEVPDSATAAPYLPAEGNRINAQVDPEGRLAVYQSDESGRYEVYVRAFPEPRQPVIVSQGGGLFPRWSPDGDTVYYWRLSDQGPDSLFAARVQRDPTFAVQRTDFVLAGDYDTQHWDLHPDGDRLVVPRLVGATRGGEDAPSDPIRHLIVTNWFAELLTAVGEGGRGR